MSRFDQPKDYYQELGEGNMPNRGFIHKFGRNSDIDGAFEAVWNGGSFYTGFDASVGEIITVESAAATDAGTLLSSGIATGGGLTTLEDLDATFSTDGVAVGDIVINDTQGMHGIVKTVDSETLLTIYRWDKAPHDLILDRAKKDDDYRVATAASTGLAVIKLEHLLDGDLSNETVEYVILNGTTKVDTTGSYRRCSRARGVLAAAASDPVNSAITVAQKVTTANIFCVLPAGANHTTIAAYTIPADAHDAHMTSWFAAFSGKVNANSNVRLRTRHQGEPFVIAEEESISGSGTGFFERKYKIPKNDLSPATDIVIEADTDTANTGVAGGFDLITHFI